LNSSVISFNSNLTLTETDISGEFSNSVIDNYNSVTVQNVNLNSVINYYNYSIVRVIDSDGALVDIDSNYTNGFDFGDFSSSISKWWLVNNGNPLVYNFTFDTDYLYFNDSVSIGSFDLVQNISLNETHIPVVDYSVNGSFQTNFRNYSLLRNITNLTNVKFSYGNLLNITFLDNLSYSDLDLTDVLSFNDNSFSVLVNSSFNFSFRSSGVSDSFMVSPINSSPIIKIGDLISGMFLENGTYLFLDDFTFNKTVPLVSPSLRDFSIDVIFLEATSDLSSSCVINFSNSSGWFEVFDYSKFDSINLVKGVYDWNLSCFGNMINQSAIGSIDVVDVDLSYLGKKFKEFNLSFISSNISDYSEECDFCQLKIGGEDVSWDHTTDSSCVAVVSGDSDFEAVVNCSSGTDYSEMIVLDDYSKVFNGRVVLGEFFIENPQYTDVELDMFSIYTGGFNFYKDLNSSYNHFEDNFLSRKTYYKSLFYFRGMLFNNKTKEKIIN
jgi:hypothetical protein